MEKFLLVFLILFGFLIAQTIGEGTLKMMRIDGEVAGKTLTGENVDEDCEQTCFNRADCILAFFNEHDYCILLDFNSTGKLEVLETTEQGGLYVSFKTTLLNDICPTYDSISLVVNLGEDPIQWTRTETGWSFKKCIEDWKMFRRAQDPEITVCIQTFKVPNIKRSEAFAFCESRESKMTGLTVAEATWIQEKYKGNLTWNTGFFMDGERDCNPPGSNCTNFKWTDGYTEGNEFLEVACLSWEGYYDYEIENCLATGFFEKYINDVMCDDSGPKQGVVCGYRLE